MRRPIALLTALAALASSLGCHHIGGKTDCGYHPSDYPIPAPTNPHASAPVAAPPAKAEAPKGGNE